MAPVGLDCGGGPAGLSSGFGVIGEGYPTGQEAAAAEVRDMPDLSVNTDAAQLVLVSRSTTESGDVPMEEWVLAQDDVVAARVTVHQYHVDGMWYVESTAKCVTDREAES